jgi:hypothetical protein
MKIQLCHWEQNGYSDSDFYTAWYDSETDTIHADCVWTTRGVMTGDPTDKVGVRVNADDPILVKAYEYLEKYIRGALVADYTRRHMEPDVEDLRVGMTCEVTRKVKCANRADKCPKCNGTGHWVNPKNSADKRECFGCKGRGANKSGGWLQIPAGTVVIVDSWESFGKFYRNGYNRPNRGNTTVSGKLVNGTVVTVKLENLKQAGEAPKEADFREKAHALACAGQFQAATGVKCAWLSEHYAPCPQSFKNQIPLEV